MALKYFHKPGGRLFKGRPLLFAGLFLVAVGAGYGIRHYLKHHARSAGAVTDETVGANQGQGVVAASAGASVTRDNVTIAMDLSTNKAASTFGHRVVDVSFSLKDLETKEPLRGRSVKAWLSKEDSEKPLSEDACKEGIRSRLSGSLLIQAGVNLNAWALFTMNEDNTISVINPQVGFSKTKLRQLVTLAGYPVDWALTPDQELLFVTIPSKGFVAVVDAFKGKIARNIDVGGQPVRVRTSRDSQTVLVADDKGDEVHVIDRKSMRVVKSVEVGDGHKEFIELDGGMFVLTAAENDEVIVFDTVKREESSRTKLSPGIVGGALANGNLVLVNEREGRLYIGQGHKIDHQRFIDVGAGVAPVNVSGNGRWIFVANPKSDRVDIYNSATLSHRYTVKGLRAPDQIHMTEKYAYVRNAGKTGVTLIQLASLDGDARPAVSEVQVGAKEPGRSHDRGIARAMVPNPEMGGMIIANPADKAIYFYQEGMMAPAGTIKNYGREPRGVLIADWSMSEKSPGVHSTRAQFPLSGRYDAYVLLSEPRVGACMKVDIPADMAMPGLDVGATAQLSWKPEWSEATRLAVGVPVKMRFTAEVRDPAGKRRPNIKDLSVRLFTPPTGPSLEVPVREVGDRFEIDVTPTTEGQLSVLLGMPESGFDFARATAVTVGVKKSL